MITINAILKESNDIALHYILDPYDRFLTPQLCLPEGQQKDSSNVNAKRDKKLQ